MICILSVHGQKILLDMFFSIFVTNLLIRFIVSLFTSNDLLQVLATTLSVVSIIFISISSHVSKSAWGLSVTICFFFRSLPPARRVKQRRFGFSLLQLYALLSLSRAPHSIRSRPSAKSFAKRISRLTIFSSIY